VSGLSANEKEGKQELLKNRPKIRYKNSNRYIRIKKT
jgi:hypothetical protein